MRARCSWTSWYTSIPANLSAFISTILLRMTTFTYMHSVSQFHLCSVFARGCNRLLANVHLKLVRKTINGWSAVSSVTVIKYYRNLLESRVSNPHYGCPLPSIRVSVWRCGATNRGWFWQILVYSNYFCWLGSNLVDSCKFWHSHNLDRALTNIIHVKWQPQISYFNCKEVNIKYLLLLLMSTRFILGLMSLDYF